MIHDDAVYVFSAFSCILAGVPCHFHHVCVGVLANHLHQAHEPPEGGECVWLRRLVIVGRDEEAWCGSADVGYSLAAWLNAAFRLIILSSESAWSCTVMAVILTTALLLCSPNGHTCTDLKKKKKRATFAYQFELWRGMHAINHSYESFPLWDVIDGSLEVF